MALRLRLISVCLISSLTSVARGAELPRLIVKRLESTTLDATRLTPLDEYILTEFQNAKRYQVIGGSDLVAMLETEAQKQLVGCDDSDCLAEIAGAMNADLIASSSVGQLDEGFMVNVKIINMRDATVVSRASVKTSSGDDGLIDGARTAVRMVTARTWVNSSNDSVPPSRPCPLSRTPPHGDDGSSR